MLKLHVFLLLFVSVFSEEQQERRHETFVYAHGQSAFRSFAVASTSDKAKLFLKEHGIPYRPKKATPDLSPPANVSATATCDSHVVATWSYGDDSSIAFWLQLCMEGIATCQNARASHDTRTFSFDVDHTENTYRFSIWASQSTTNEEVNSTAVALNVTTFPNIPLMDSATVSGASASSFRITWTTEWKYTLRFSVCLLQGVKEQCRDYIVPGLQLAYTITGLNASTLYEVDTTAQVTRYGLTCTGPVFEQDVSTFAFDIGPVRNLTHVVVNVTIISISWQEPKESGDLTGYAINCKDKEGSQSASAELPRSRQVTTTLDLQLQLANFTCTVNAFADTPSGRQEGIPNTFDVMTEGIAAPRDVTLLNTTETTLTYSWRADPIAGKYRISVKAQPSNRPFVNFTENHLRQPNAEFVHHTVFGLSPGTFYEISVQNCADYCGLSTVVSDTTEVAAPSQVLNLGYSLEGYVNVTLTWTRPEEPNGPIDGYFIKISNKDNNRTEDHYVQGDSLSFSHSLRELFSYFKASVSPYNIDHYLNVTLFGLQQNIEFATLGEGPFPPSPEAVSTRERRALIFWKVPLDPRYDISRYLVNLNDTTSFFTPDNHCWLDELAPFEHYTVEVSSCTNKDCGEAHSVSFRTDPGFPSIPENLTVDSRNSTWILLEWQHPETPNGPISGYKVTWTDGEKTYVSVATEQSFSCTSLKPGTVYKISVYAFNDHLLERKSGPAALIEAATDTDGGPSERTSTLRLAAAFTASCVLISAATAFIVFKRRRQKNSAAPEEFDCRPLVSEETPPPSRKNFLNCLSSSV